MGWKRQKEKDKMRKIECERWSANDGVRRLCEKGEVEKQNENRERMMGVGQRERETERENAGVRYTGRVNDEIFRQSENEEDERCIWVIFFLFLPQKTPFLHSWDFTVFLTTV